ncbi:uncharacterized protein LOC110763145 [Prunus avium]|uniref:Uncharacterized protein LOC110763145 n=1 Tax=Prunus avium TaxID=42229 RepID=A0A6P5T448_PRUAV|nr:uncharacterized protein LOC110763145 [Prunus avium]XP_021821593.1 uncharacterized protein LOC110763145 [Prunus avium]XP_021821594.1 uncharacterized protein LOC110763145 [Prunus avium]
MRQPIFFGTKAEQEMEASNIPVSMPRVNLKDTIEELLKFTLQSCTNGTLEIDLGLPKELCSRLLKPEPNDLSSPSHFDSSTGIFEGIPPYPLYKRLALALHESIASGTLFGSCNNMAIIHQESALKEKENEWQKLISEKGSELVNVLKTVKIELHVQEPFFSQLKDGLKTIEGRCALGNCSRIDSGSLILFNKCLLFEVQDIHSYSSFSDMMEAEGLSKVLPGVETIEEGAQIYRKFYTEEKERSNGVLAICVSKFPLQPYISLARMLFGLSLGGLQGLLGLAHTTGSTPDALPPPTSTLLSSFVLPYKLNVEGSTLTHGARALAKHAHRSSSKYWGSLDGSDSNKNRLALDVISRLMTHCCWLNVHSVQPHGVVFEIRVAEGYGARWSEDGSKFIGFLEPYMEDGHPKGWKH